MKLVNREQIENLARFRSKDFLTTSFFLDTSKNRLSKKEILLSLKNLYNRNKSRVNQMGLSKRKRDSLYEDLEKIKDFCSQSLPSNNYVGLALFSCSNESFWEVFHLVKSPRNMVVFDNNPYIRPLSAILDEYHRTCLFTIDRKEAKWYDIYMGNITLLDTMKGDVPSKVKEGGWEGYSSKRIERHLASRMQDFFKKAAKKTFDLTQGNNFVWLFLGCKEEYFHELTPLLHPYLKKKLKTHLHVNPSDSPPKILEKALELKNKFKKEENQEIVEKFLHELKKGGLATSGLKRTLRKLNTGEVQTLLVTRHFSKPGKKCPKCQFLFEDESTCPACQIKTEAAPDIIDLSVEQAFNSSCRVRHINPPSQLDRYGGIGAFLRYKT